MVFAGRVVVVEAYLVGVGIARHEQAEVRAGPANFERQVGRAIGVGPTGGGGGGGALLAIRPGGAGSGLEVGMYVAPTSQVEVMLTGTTG